MKLLIEEIDHAIAQCEVCSTKQYIFPRLSVRPAKCHCTTCSEYGFNTANYNKSQQEHLDRIRKKFIGMEIKTNTRNYIITNVLNNNSILIKHQDTGYESVIEFSKMKNFK